MVAGFLKGFVYFSLVQSKKTSHYYIAKQHLIMTILQKHLIFIPLFLVAMVALVGGLVMWLWNWLMPLIFALPQLTFWQSVGLVVLCRLLVGNVGFGGHHHHHAHGQSHCCGGSNKLRESWANMTPEERQRIIDKHVCDDSAPRPTDETR